MTIPTRPQTFPEDVNLTFSVSRFFSVRLSFTITLFCAPMKRARSERTTKQWLPPLLDLIDDMKTAIVNLLPYPALSALAQTCKPFASFLTKSPGAPLFVPWRWRKKMRSQNCSFLYFRLFHDAMHASNFFRRLGPHLDLVYIDFLYSSHIGLYTSASPLNTNTAYWSINTVSQGSQLIADSATFVKAVHCAVVDQRADALLAADAEYARLKKVQHDAWQVYELHNKAIYDYKIALDDHFNNFHAHELVDAATSIADAMRASSALEAASDTARAATDLYAATIKEKMRKEAGVE